MTNDGDESECDDGTIYGGPESEVTLTVYVYKKPRFVWFLKLTEINKLYREHSKNADLRQGQNLTWDSF